ncbi:MAG: GspH/FimT family pseudopilin [Desulfomonilia bacterium]
MDTRGFTMIELVMVIVIIAVLGALAIPNMDGWFAKRQLDEAARTMFSHFQEARSEAIRENTSVQIRIDLANEWYDIQDINGNTVVPQMNMPDGIDLLASTFPLNALNYNTTGLTSRGFATQQGSVTILSTEANPADNQRIITLTLGGSVSIQP